MKKSTVFLLALIYVVSVIVVGFFGAKIRASNVYVYVDSISVSDPTNTTLTLDRETNNNNKHFYMFYADYNTNTQGKCVISLKTEAKPTNANEKEVLYVEDSSITEFFVTKSEGDENVFVITFNEKSNFVGTFKSNDIKGVTVDVWIVFND